MGYKIQYGPALKAEIKSRSFWKKQWKAAAVLTAMAAALVLVFIGETETLRDVFLPGDADVTHRALIELTENIREGESFADAITVFCLEIIEGAELP